jgi:outer membrane protein OmpA-like peptidoglycan-associated protein
LAPVLGALAIAACSAEEAVPQESGEAVDPAVVAPLPSSGSATGPGTLRADVSGLTGDISGLSTRRTEFGLVIDLPSDALFEFDKAELTPDAEAQLRKAAEVIGRAPPGEIGIVGHTDGKGDDAYNQNLSEARAQTVANWFRQQVGIRQRDFTVSGKGETAPIEPNEDARGADNPAGRAKNRRVEVIVPTG